MRCAARRDCLAANNFQEPRCQLVIDWLYRCCDKMVKADSSARSTACPNPEALEAKMKEMRERK